MWCCVYALLLMKMIYVCAVYNVIDDDDDVIDILFSLSTSSSCSCVFVASSFCKLFICLSHALLCLSYMMIMILVD